MAVEAAVVVAAAVVAEVAAAVVVAVAAAADAAFRGALAASAKPDPFPITSAKIKRHGRDRLGRPGQSLSYSQCLIRGAT